MSSEIFLICADEISREGLTHILQSAGFRIRGSFERLNSVPPVEMSDALLLIDCPSPLDQADAVHIARNRFPTAKVILLSKSFEPSSMIECFNQGAAGYIVKSATSSRLVASLRLAAVGEKVIPSHFVDLLRDRGPGYSIMNRGESAIEKANLTPRELDVLCCLMAGYSNKIIARRLALCEATVKVHVKAILRKLNVLNRTQAAIWASTRDLPENHLVF